MQQQKVLIFHGWRNTNTDEFACVNLLSDKLKSDGYNVTFDTLHYESGISVDEILERYSDWNYDIVIWHSAGGFLALQYAQFHYIKRLILIAPCTSTKNFTNSFIAELEEDFSPEEHQIFNDFHDHGIRHIDVNNNCHKISFVFGQNDESITKEVANIYTKTYPKAKYIYLFAGHMGNSLEDGGHKIMEIYDRLFPKEII